MAISFTLEEAEELRPQITVFGVGGAGGNAVNNMITSGLTGVSFVIANTDAQALAQSHASEKIQIGRAITQGLGAGAKPEIGRAAAEETLPEIVKQLEGSHMCFIAAGMGGGTGTGAAPVIARAAKEMDILTVGVVTKPFQFEGANRMKLALQGIEDLQQYVDTLIVIPNQNLFRIANERTTFSQAFQLADQVLHSGVRGVTDLMLLPGLINLDFADVRSVMSEMGKAMMGTGEGEGDQRASSAAEAAISNPLLDDISLKGARAVLINITGGEDLTLFDVDEATNRIRNDVDPEANIIFGAVFNEDMTGKVRVSVVATGIDGGRPAQPAHSDFDMMGAASSYPTAAAVSAPEKTEKAAVVSGVQPMFPSANKAWGQTAAPETKKPQEEPALKASPVYAAAPETGAKEKKQAPSFTPKAETAGRDAEKAPSVETVDNLVEHFAGSDIKKQAPSFSAEREEERGDDKQTGGAFGGFFGSVLRGSAAPKPEKKPLETVGVQEEPKDKKDEDNFEIPAFLRRSIY